MPDFPPPVWIDPAAERTTGRAAVNHSNAQHSTGPRTRDGKLRSSRNALTHGLTARTVLLPSEDPAAHQRHTQDFFDEYARVHKTGKLLILQTCGKRETSRISGGCTKSVQNLGSCNGAANVSAPSIELQASSQPITVYHQERYTTNTVRFNQFNGGVQCSTGINSKLLECLGRKNLGAARVGFFRRTLEYCWVYHQIQLRWRWSQEPWCFNPRNPPLRSKLTFTARIG